MGGSRGSGRAHRGPRRRHRPGLRRLPHHRHREGRMMAPSHRAGRRSGLLGGALGVLGELLLTAGVLMLLFLIWQLWWTDVLADREHSDIIAGLEDEWGDLDDEEIAPRQDGDPPVPDTIGDTMEIGRASCRERVEGAVGDG